MGGMTRKRNDRRYPMSIRPVVLGPGGDLVDLEYYDGSSGGTNINGWSKARYRRLLTPPAPPMDISASLGSLKWELGVNIMIFGWHWEVNWYSGLVMTPAWPVTTTGTSTTTWTLRALDGGGAVAGTISTTTWTTNDTMTTSLSGFPQQPTFNFSLGYVVASGGSWAGSMNAIEIEKAWSGSVTTTNTTIGDPIFIDDNWYSNFGPVISR